VCVVQAEHCAALS